MVSVTGGADRFNTNSEGYARYRPRYPQEMMRSLADDIIAARTSAGPLVIDVGCGTGIFTRQLAAALPADCRVVGVEPAQAMRESAIRHSRDLAIAYVEGRAEALPARDGEAWAVTAATAAHWFERPMFYAEASRVLGRGGVLAIVEYVRDVDHSPAAAAIEDFLRREGGPKAYVRPDYALELGGLPEFTLSPPRTQKIVVPLDVEGFVGLALSSSHARPVVARLGQPRAEAALAGIGAELADADGRIPYCYDFRLFVAKRRG